MIGESVFSNVADAPESSKVWVFTLNRQIDNQEAQGLRQQLANFVAQWTAHEAKVHGVIEVVYGRFIIAVADSRAADVTGCSIGSLFSAVENCVKEAGLSLVDPGNILCRIGVDIKSFSRDEFQDLCSAGKVNADTTVFNNSISTFGELSSGRWELPFSRSWHASRFELGAR